jgi:hypothetical protein
MPAEESPLVGSAHPDLETLSVSSDHPQDLLQRTTPEPAVDRLRSLTQSGSSSETFQPTQRLEEAEDSIGFSNGDEGATPIDPVLPSSRNSEIDIGLSSNQSINQDERISPEESVGASDVGEAFPSSAPSMIEPESMLEPVAEGALRPDPSIPDFGGETTLRSAHEASDRTTQPEEQPNVPKTEKRQDSINTSSGRRETMMRRPTASKSSEGVVPTPTPDPAAESSDESTPQVEPVTSETPKFFDQGMPDHVQFAPESPAEISMTPDTSPMAGTDAPALLDSAEKELEPKPIPNVEPPSSVPLPGKVESTRSESGDETGPDPIQNQVPELELRPFVMRQTETAEPGSQVRQQADTASELEEIPPALASGVAPSAQPTTPTEPAPTLSSFILPKPTKKPAGSKQTTTTPDKPVNQEATAPSSIASISRTAEQTDIDQSIANDIEEMRSPGPTAPVMRDPADGEPSLKPVPDQFKPVTKPTPEPDDRPEKTRSATTSMTNNLGGTEEKSAPSAADPGHPAINEPEPEVGPSFDEAPAPVVTRPTSMPATNSLVAMVKPAPEVAGMIEVVQASRNTSVRDELPEPSAGSTISPFESADIDEPIPNEVEAVTSPEKPVPVIRTLAVETPLPKPDQVDRSADLPKFDDRPPGQQDQPGLLPTEHAAREGIQQTEMGQTRPLTSGAGRPAVIPDEELLARSVSQPRQSAIAKPSLNEPEMAVTTHEPAPALLRQDEVHEGTAAPLNNAEITADPPLASGTVPEQTLELSLPPTSQTVIAHSEDSGVETEPLADWPQVRPETRRLRLDEVFAQPDIEVESPGTIQRSPDAVAGSESGAAGVTSSTTAPPQSEADPGQEGVDIETMARQVYQILRRRLRVEKERYRG